MNRNLPEKGELVERFKKHGNMACITVLAMIGMLEGGLDESRQALLLTRAVTRWYGVEMNPDKNMDFEAMKNSAEKLNKCLRANSGFISRYSTCPDVLRKLLRSSRSGLSRAITTSDRAQYAPFKPYDRNDSRRRHY